jgi:hypothetical protein
MKKGYSSSKVGTSRETDSIILLHLSDLHFGWDADEQKRTDRELALKGLLNVLNDLDTDWIPNCICISGDIGWRGHENDYEAAAQWLNELLGILKLSPEAVFVCPGNHDVNRNLAKLNARPNTSQEADEILGAVPIPKHLQDPFQAFIKFCQDFGISPFSFGEDNSYLVGYRSYRGGNFVAYNSAWFSKGDDDQGKLWIGLPQIKALERHGQLPSPNQLNEWPDTVALLHHSREWFHEMEIRADENSRRPNTFDYLAQRCHLLLTGHTHGEVRRADQFAESTWHLSGGAAYAGASHFNSFRLIRFESDHFIYRSFEFDPRSSDNAWRSIGDANSLPKKRDDKLLSKYDNTDTFDLTIYRNNALADAHRFVNTKSRALKPSGTLPEILPLAVAVHDKNLHHRFSPKGELLSETQTLVTVSLFEAMKQSRRILLLGDLGTGKSTLAGLLVEQVLQEMENALAYIVPAKSLKFELPLTVRSLLQAVSDFFNDQISPTISPIDQESFLKKRVEVVIIIDGLDEVPIPQATELLSQLGGLTDHWPNIRVLATGRPVELQGVSYQDWQVLSTIPLKDNERFHLFKEEAISEGRTMDEAEAIAKQLLEQLRTLPALNSLATTPLVVRLLYPKLQSVEEGQTYTLGDLLYSLIKERLGGWAKKDRKLPTTQQFEAKFPDETSRIALLGAFALKLKLQDSLPIENARLYLQGLIRQYDASSELPLTQEALDFFEQSGIIIISDDSFHFPIQPFLGFLGGYALAMIWRNKEKAPAWLDSKHWRVVSFTATMLRRFGLNDHSRSQLLDFLQDLLLKEQNVPAASYIISEAQDAACAEAFIDNISRLGPRPLRVFYDEQVQSAQAIAQTIKLAGQTGFDWFFEQYLNPQYPLSNTGSQTIDNIFEQWVYLSLDEVSEHEKSQLNKLIIPHTHAATMQLLRIIPLLAVIIPEAFQVSEKLWFCGRFLDRGLFSIRAKQYFREEFEAGHKTLVNNVLMKHAQAGYENAASAAWLWMTINNSERPNAIILKTLIRAYDRSWISLDREKYISHCIERIGSQNWDNLLRWCLFDNDHRVAAGAAMELYSLGERRLSFLGEPLLKALHDGGYVKQAEKILGSLVREIGPPSVRWLANQIAATAYGPDNAHSGWWRIFLSRLEELGDEGPPLLASSIGGIGPYLLPRYPEVRQLFCNLLSGPQGEDYRDSLREQLYDLSPATRHGAAMVLVICDPQNESFALEMVTKLRRRRTFGLWGEWERFCLSLSFGPSVLSYLESKLPTLDSSALIFALAILHRNGIKLNDKNYEKLIDGLLELDNWALDPQEQDLSVLANSNSFEILVNIVEEKGGKKANRAAAELLQHHSDRLSSSLRAKCINLSIDNMKLWHWSRAYDQIENLKTNSTYAQEVKEAATQIITQGGEKPLLELIRLALDNESRWEDVVWRLLCDKSPSGFDLDDNGLWLLDYGRMEPNYGTSIGKAARKFLNDPRLKSSPQGEIRQWLAVLADEFIGLSTEDMNSALLQGRPISGSAASALIARLGNNVPTGYQKRDSVGSVPLISVVEDEISPTFSDRLDQLKEMARSSDSLHPNVCQVLENMALEVPLSDQDLKRLAAEGVHGVLISSALSFVYGRSPNPKLAAKLLYLPRNLEEPQNPCFNHLARIFRNGQYIAIEEDEEIKTAYLSILDNKLTYDNGEIFAIATELLALRGYLTEEQIILVLNKYAKHPEYQDFGLGDRLTKWFAGDFDESSRVILIDELERGLEMLDTKPWDRGMNNEFRFLLFPVAYWRLTEKITEKSIHVFLRGIKFTFQLRNDPHGREGPVAIMARIEPLLSKVSKSILREVLAFGQTIDDPAVRSLCKIFGS